MNHDCTLGSVPLRTTGVDGSRRAVDVRRCLFKDASGGVGPIPGRLLLLLLLGVPRAPAKPVGSVLTVEARGREEEDASLGNPEPPLRALPFGAPEARFLFLMTSVFNDNGRTTPCNLKNSPQALHNGCPSGSRLHSGVLVV